MSLTTADIQKALKIKKVVSEYFDNSTETTVMAKDLMKLLIAKGIFTKDHQEGFPIREFLRELEKDKNLKLIPQAHFFAKRTKQKLVFYQN
jgi:hypothetical protein